MPVWRNPVAWFGLVALAIPIAIHLLARMRARVVQFPSLRFIEVSRLAARKRRTLSDIGLLALRLLALLLAIAATADPLFLTSARRTAWSTRVSRAVVIDTSASVTQHTSADAIQQVAAKETQAGSDLLRSTVIRSASLSDGAARAVAWLRTTPPSRREIVFVSDFQVDTVTAGLLRDVPDDIGLRFARVGELPHDQTADARPVTRRGGAGAYVWTRAKVRVDDERTTITKRETAALAPFAVATTDDGLTLAPFGLHITVPKSDRATALATTEAVLTEGVPAPAPGQTDRRVELAVSAPITTNVAALSAPWMAEALQRIAEDPALRATASNLASTAASAASNVPAPWRMVLADERGVPLLIAAEHARQPQTLVLESRVPASSAVTPFLIRSVLRALATPDDLQEAEVRTIPDRALAAWTRPATEPSIDALENVEDSDRRWLWAAALAVLLIETWVRRDRQRARGDEASAKTNAKAEAHEHAA